MFPELVLPKTSEREEIPAFGPAEQRAVALSPRQPMNFSGSAGYHSDITGI